MKPQVILCRSPNDARAQPQLVRVAGLGSPARHRPGNSEPGGCGGVPTPDCLFRRRSAPPDVGHQQPQCRRRTRAEHRNAVGGVRAGTRSGRDRRRSSGSHEPRVVEASEVRRCDHHVRSPTCCRHGHGDRGRAAALLSPLRRPRRAASDGRPSAAARARGRPAALLRKRLPGHRHCGVDPSLARVMDIASQLSRAPGRSPASLGPLRRGASPVVQPQVLGGLTHERRLVRSLQEHRPMGQVANPDRQTTIERSRSDADSVSTRYDRPPATYLAGLRLRGAMIWLRSLR